MRDKKTLSHKAGVFEAMNDTLHTKLRFMNDEMSSNEAKLEYLLTQNSEMGALIEKLRGEKDALLMLLKEHGVSITVLKNFF